MEKPWVAHGEVGCKRQGVERRVWSEIEAALGERVVRGELMSRHTTARAGGPADLFIEATSSVRLKKAPQAGNKKLTCLPVNFAQESFYLVIGW